LLQTIKTGGYLNEQGNSLYPGIFPQGRVPLKSILMERALLMDQGKTVEKEIFRIDISKLSDEQYDAVIALVAKTNNLSDAYVKLSLDQLGYIPIRAELISTTFTDSSFFLGDAIDDDFDDDDDDSIIDEELYDLEKIDDDFSEGLGDK